MSAESQPLLPVWVRPPPIANHHLPASHFRPVMIDRPKAYLNDAYFWLQGLGWLGFMGVFAVIYVFLALLFVGLQAFDRRGLQGVSDRFDQLLLLNINILSGSGSGTPATTYMNILLALEGLVQVFLFALVTGLVYARFARPSARLRFSERILISPGSSSVPGAPTVLSLRMVNMRSNWLVRMDVVLEVVMNTRNADGSTFRKIVDLNLRRSTLSNFSVPLTLFHDMDESSPLHGYTAEMLERDRVTLTVSVQASDEIQVANVFASHTYDYRHFIFADGWSDLFTHAPDGSATVSLAHFDEVKYFRRSRAVNE